MKWFIVMKCRVRRVVESLDFFCSSFSMYYDNNPSGLGEDQSGAPDTNGINKFRHLGRDLVVIRPAFLTDANIYLRLSISEVW